MSVLSVPLNRAVEHQAAFERPHTPVRAPLPVENATRSFWLHSAPDANPLAREGSTGPLTSDADICIIGSGITGISAAYNLAQAVRADPALGPLSVVVLEARDFCSGATGRNGGHLAPVSFFGFRNRVAKYGVESAKRTVALEEHTATSVTKIVTDAGLEDAIDFVDGGRTNLFLTEEEEKGAKADFEAAKNAGVDLSSIEWLEKDEVQKRYGANYSAVRVPAHNVWPLKLVTQLFTLAQHATPAFSLHLHTHTPATAIAPATSPGRRWTVSTPRGGVSCSTVLHATNGYASHLLPSLAGPRGIVPTRGQIVAVRAEAPAQAITTSGWTANDHFEYWFPRPLAPGAEDQRPLVILGGGREAKDAFEFGEADDSVLDKIAGRALRGFLPAVFPGKYEIGREPEMEWTGIMGFTSNGDPFVGPVVEEGKPVAGQFIAAGYTGHGMPRAFACAEAAASMITAELAGKEWSPPDWLPRHYITTSTNGAQQA
ncbi:DAO-domain-containing protein [Dentipellis sp. KUC8613]|nr:DAO-domain-containing protein [Dentipellis sp. KUC8613]